MTTIKRNLNDLLSFVVIAREGTFTRAATQLGVTQSALSQSISGLEARLQIRLLTCITHSVSPTATGEYLLNAIGSHFDGVEAGLDELSASYDKPSGMVRITCDDHIQRASLLPRPTPLLPEYPDVKVEFGINYVFRDIVVDRFDVDVRLGDTIDKDMITVSIGPPVRMAVVATPAYFAAHPKPRSPHNLVGRSCTNIRMQSGGGLYAWDLQRKDRYVNIRVGGRLIFNASSNIVDAALAGLGIVWLPEKEFAPHIEEGWLPRVSENWCPLSPDYYLYYPNRRQPSLVFDLAVDTLRYTRPKGTAPQTLGSGHAGIRLPATHHGVDDLQKRQ